MQIDMIFIVILKGVRICFLNFFVRFSQVWVKFQVVFGENGG